MIPPFLETAQNETKRYLTLQKFENPILQLRKNPKSATGGIKESSKCAEKGKFESFSANFFCVSLSYSVRSGFFASAFLWRLSSVSRTFKEELLFAL